MRIGSGDNSIEVNIRKSLKAKSLRIKVSASKGVELIIPRNYSVKSAFVFLQEKQMWVMNKLAQIKVAQPTNDDEFLIYGVARKILFSSENIPQLFIIQDDVLLVSKQLHRSDLPLMLGAFLKNMLKKDIEEYANKLCPKLGVSYRRITLKDTKNQWGSCSYAGNLSFSWRLICAPKHVIEYLVVHEVCHLVERNHSDRFWKLVALNFPEYKSSQAWLKKNGRRLHSLPFFDKSA